MDIINAGVEIKKSKKRKKRDKADERDAETERDECNNDSGTADGKTCPEVDVTPQSPKRNKKKRNRVSEEQQSVIPEDETHLDKPRKRRKTSMTRDEMPLELAACEQDATDLIFGEESDSTAVQIGTRKIKRKQKEIETDVFNGLVSELKEFYPNVESKGEDKILKLIKYDLPRFKNFKKQGISLRRGRFSSAENQRLRANILDFMALTGVDCADKFLRTKRFPDEKEKLIRLKRNYRFLTRISEGIPRSCFDVFTRARKVSDGDNYKGRFTEHEVKKLLKLHTLYGSNWQKISELTGRSSYSLEKRFNQISSKVGPWTDEENQQLLRAVRDAVVAALRSRSPDGEIPGRVGREALFRKLPWCDIALKVKTRSWIKCRVKWMSILAARMSSATDSRATKEMLDAKVRLIKAMYELNVDDVADVDWDDLTTVLGDVPPAYVQAKWHLIKVSHVPNWKTKCFGDVVDYLYEKTLPQLLKKCKDIDSSSLKFEQQQSFLLSEIFQDIQDKQ